jgi:peptidoglycan/LPS O-acetylase OafA/YrhL
MKKIKIKRRIENAAAAFFAGEITNENDSMSFANGSDVLRNESAAGFYEKAEVFTRILKQVFLFFPGTLLLFVLSLGTAISILAPLGSMNLNIGFGQFFLLFAAGIFMTWFGIGDLRKPKHFVIPLSIAATGALLGAVSAILMASSGAFRKIVFSDAFPLYLLPLALIVPFLAKGLVDRDSQAYK